MKTIRWLAALLAAGMLAGCSLGLEDLAELPAAPCLSSRLETGIRVTAERLELVHAVERLIQEDLEPQTVRCRLLQDGVAIELDSEGLDRILSAASAGVRQTVAQLLARHGHTDPVRYRSYRMGSAFHRPATRG